MTMPPDRREAPEGIVVKTSHSYFQLSQRWIGQAPAACLVVAACLLGNACHAFKPANVGLGEIAMLPAYCIDTEAFMHGPKNSPTQSPRAPEWEAKMGYSFWAMHHYCWGLVNLNRLRFGRAETNNKRFFAQQIANEYLYVVQNSTADFVMLPEIWARVGEALLLAGDIGGAMDAYAKARSIKPDYAPAYVQWAEFQMNNGRREEARALVDAGLTHLPESKPLLDLRRKLGPATATATASARANRSADAPKRMASDPQPAATSASAAGKPP